MKYWKISLLLLLFTLLSSVAHAQDTNKEDCKLFARITINAAEKYSAKNDNVLSAWLAAALEEEAFKRGSEALLYQQCEVVISHSSQYLELAAEGLSEILEDVHHLLQELQKTDDDVIIRIDKD